MSLAFSLHPGAVLSVLLYGLILGWIAWRWGRKSIDPPGVLALKIVLSVGLGGTAVWVGAKFHPLIGIPLAAALAIVVGILWGANVGNAIAKPLAGLYDGGDEAPEPRPFYAIAQAHRKQARYAAAITEIEKQLERFPGDVEGLLMLAEIRGRHLSDWEGARAAIERVVADEQNPVPVRAKALQALADWLVDLAQDSASARECLERIRALFPGTMEDSDAAQRLAHLGDDAWRREQRAPSRIRMVQGEDRLGLRGVPLRPPPERDPNEEAAELRAQLAAHPLDTEARERLALVLADRLGRLGDATGELEHLVAMGAQSPRAVARWLHLLADIQVRCAGDEGAARAALGRVGELFPGSAVAATAQARLDHLKLEMRRRDAARVVGRPGGPAGDPSRHET